jgi:hypothetical protein
MLMQDRGDIFGEGDIAGGRGPLDAANEAANGSTGGLANLLAGEQIIKGCGDEVFRRGLAGDGSFGGFYERPDEEMLQIWAAAVDEVRALLESGWDA